MLKFMYMERQDYIEEQAKCRKKIAQAYSFAKYECNKYAAVVTHENMLEKYIENLRSSFNEKENSKIIGHDMQTCIEK